MKGANGSIHGAIPEKLTPLLEWLIIICGRQELTIGVLIGALGPKGLPALLLIPTLLLLVPFGFFPGSAALLAMLSILIAAQMMIGMQKAWMPQFVLKVRLPSATVAKGFSKLLPIARWLDGKLGNHLHSLAAHPVSVRCVGLVVIILSLIVAVFGIVPGVSTIVSSLILVLILGLLLHDGVIVLLGYLAVALLALLAWVVGTHFWMP